MKGSKNAKVLEEFLKRNDWNYRRIDREDGAIFEGGIGGLGGAYDSVRFIAIAEENFVQSYVFLPSKAEGKKAEMGEFLHRATYGMRQGAFEMDWRDGEIRFHMTYPDCVLETEDREACLSALLLLPAQIIRRYSKGIAAVLLDLATPEQAIAMCEGDQE